MSENEKPVDETQPVRPQGQPEPASAVQPTPEPAPEPAPVAAGPVTASAPAASGSRWGRLRRWRNQQPGDRTYGLAALVASALAGIIVGGVGTAVFHAVTDDHDRGGWVERHGPMGRGGFDRGDDDRGPWFGGPRGVPGEIQPSTPPEDDGGSSS